MDGKYKKQAFSILENVSIELLNEDLSGKEMKESIKEHDISYFIGGKPERLIHVIEEKGLAPIIKRLSRFNHRI